MSHLPAEPYQWTWRERAGQLAALIGLFLIVRMFRRRPRSARA